MNNFYYLEHALHTGLDNMLTWSPEEFKSNTYLSNNCAVKDNTAFIYGYPVSSSKVEELQILLSDLLNRLDIRIKRIPNGIQIYAE